MDPSNSTTLNQPPPTEANSPSPSPSSSPSSDPSADASPAPLLVEPAEAHAIARDELTIHRSAEIARANAARREAEARQAKPVLPPLPAPDRRTPSQIAASEIESQRRDRVEKLLKAARIPRRFQGASLEKLQDVPLWTRAEYRRAAESLARLHDEPVIVALIGPRGPGKTWLGCALAQDFCRRGRSAVYLDAMDYFAELKTTYDRNARRDEHQVEVDYIRPELLVLDELHERGDTPWEDRMLTRLVNKRYAEERATLLISNQDKKTFEERVGDSIADRITDFGGYIACNWRSLRGQIGQVNAAAEG